MADDRGRIPSQKLPAVGQTNEAFVAERLAAFQSHVLGPMLQQASADPDSALTLIAHVRAKLDALEVVLGLEAGGQGSAPTTAISASAAPRHPAFQAVLEMGRKDDQPIEGQGEEIGRNARARLRELTLLEALAERGRAYTLPQLMTALAMGGFADSTDAAVVSQLHRLKKNDVIHQPANGLYEITDGGLAHLRKLRNSVGALLG